MNRLCPTFPRVGVSYRAARLTFSRRNHPWPGQHRGDVVGVADSISTHVVDESLATTTTTQKFISTVAPLGKQSRIVADAKPLSRSLSFSTRYAKSSSLLPRPTFPDLPPRPPHSPENLISRNIYRRVIPRTPRSGIRRYISLPRNESGNASHVSERLTSTVSLVSRVYPLAFDQKYKKYISQALVFVSSVY